MTRELVHKKLNTLMRKMLPSAAEETADPGAAGEIYEARVDYLKGQTRDRKKFHLVFEETCSYTR